VLLETKCGDPHPDTGIPPAFLTVKWSESVGKASKIDAELGRPMKLHYSITQWRFIVAIENKLKHCFCVSIFNNWLVGIKCSVSEENCRSKNIGDLDRSLNEFKNRYQF
jgi:hypothetical protein